MYMHFSISVPMGLWMTFHIFIALFTYAFFPKIPKIGKAIPGSLAAIIATTVVEWGFVRPVTGEGTNTVEDLASVSVSLNFNVHLEPVYFNNNIIHHSYHLSIFIHFISYLITIRVLSHGQYG